MSIKPFYIDILYLQSFTRTPASIIAGRLLVPLYFNVIGD